MRKGTAVLVTGAGNTLLGGMVEDYRTGIKVTGQDTAIVFVTACDNNRDMLNEGNMQGAFNTCDLALGWSEGLSSSCTFGCEGQPAPPPPETSTTTSTTLAEAEEGGTGLFGSLYSMVFG